MRRHGIILVPVLALLLAAQSCIVREPVERTSQLFLAGEDETLVLLGRDSTLYRLPEFSVRHDTIFGRGTREDADSSSAFVGAIGFEDVEYAQLEYHSVLGSVFVVVPVTVFSTMVLGSLMSKSTSSVEEYRYSSGGGSSCPYVYSWNGRDFILEAETFGTSLGRALQRTTRHVLPSLRDEEGLLRLRIRNERPETHYIDRVALTRVRHVRGTRIVMDTEGNAWQVGSLAAPTSIRHGATEERRVYSFSRPAHVTRALLVVTAINRDMAKDIFQETFSYLGKDALRFVRDIETDAITVENLRQWLIHCGLQVSIGTDAAQRKSGMIDPEATAVEFTRAIPIELSGSEGGDLTVTLEALAGLWDVREVRIAWDAVDGLEETEVPLASCEGPDGSDPRALLASSDGAYCTLLPPQSVDLSFHSGETDARYSYSYCLAAEGYLHLWYSATKDAQLFAAFDDIPPSMRRAFVRMMLGQPSLVLPLLRAAGRNSDRDILRPAGSSSRK